jgi:protein SCO1/2
MNRSVAAVAALLMMLACSKGEGWQSKPVSEAGEKLYTVKGKILSRDAGENSVRMDHEAIPGFMEAMVMDYSVRGAGVDSLPENGARIEARVHVTERAYWITDARRIP